MRFTSRSILAAVSAGPLLAKYLMLYEPIRMHFPGWQPCAAAGASSAACIRTSAENINALRTIMVSPIVASSNAA